MGGWVGRGATGLEVTDNTRHRSVLGQPHDRWKRYPLATGFGHESRPQAMTAKISLQPRQSRPPLHDFANRGRGESRAHALFPQPSANAARSSTGLSGVEVAVTPDYWVLLCSKR